MLTRATRRAVPVIALLLVAVIATAVQRRPPDLTVFAAASLTDGFEALADSFTHRHPGLQLRFNFAGSQQLALQLAQGARADVFASADERWMAAVRDSGLIAGEPQVFVHNRLVVIVPRANPAGITGLTDLARPGVKLALATEAVPVGRYSGQLLERLSARPGFGPEYATRVRANVVSMEENVKAVVAKVQLGEVDGGIAYRSDLTPAVLRDVSVLEVPAGANIIASYPAAALRHSRSPELAQAFVDFMRSATGQQILARAGFTPVAAP